jgi:hypothetical protein
MNENYHESLPTCPLETDYSTLFDSYDMEQVVKDFIAMEEDEIRQQIMELIYNNAGYWPDTWRERLYTHPEYWPDDWKEQMLRNSEDYFPDAWLQRRRLNPEIEHGLQRWVIVNLKSTIDQMIK